MRFLFVLAALVLAVPSAAQESGQEAALSERVQQELQALVTDLNRAVQGRDRAALERIFAPEFVWVHGFGYVDDRDAHIEGVLSVDSPRQLPPLDFAPPNQFFIYGNGDVAMLRQPTRPTQLADAVWGTAVYVHRDGRWQIAQIQGTIMQPDRAYLTLDAASLDGFAGRYSANGRVTVISREGGELHARVPGVPLRRLRPVADNRFFDKLGSEYVFERGPNGAVSLLLVRFPGGREARLTPVE